MFCSTAPLKYGTVHAVLFKQLLNIFFQVDFNPVISFTLVCFFFLLSDRAGILKLLYGQVV